MSLPLDAKYIVLRIAMVTGFVASLFFSLPVSLKAAEPVSSGTGGGYFATPYMMRGEFVFIQRISRRTLLLTMKALQPKLQDLFVQEYL